MRAHTLADMRAARRNARHTLRAVRGPNEYRKHKALDCGNPRCHLCHSDKFPKREPTRQEVLCTGD